MPLSAKLQEFLTKANLKEDVGKWLESVGYVSYENVALIAENLEGVTTGLHAVSVFPADLKSSTGPEG